MGNLEQWPLPATFEEIHRQSLLRNRYRIKARRRPTLPEYPM